MCLENISGKVLGNIYCWKKLFLGEKVSFENILIVYSCVFVGKYCLEKTGIKLKQY